MSYEWDSFVIAADEWIIAYSLPPANLTSVKLFSIGHAVELYLKAAYTKMTGNIKEAIGFGHKIVKIWDDCKKQDPNFLPSYELRHSILKADIFQANLHEQLAKEDFKHYLENQELYIIAKILPDLKYLGAPLKNIKGAWAFGYVFPNPYWIEFFKEIRSYLGYDKNKLDIISHHLQERDLPIVSSNYLASLFN